MKTTCPACQTVLAVKADAETEMKCYMCGHVFAIGDDNLLVDEDTPKINAWNEQQDVPSANPVKERERSLIYTISGLTLTIVLLAVGIVWTRSNLESTKARNQVGGKKDPSPYEKQPAVFSTRPFNYQNDVNPILDKIIVEFDQVMDGTYSLVQDRFPFPKVTGDPIFEPSRLRFVLPVKLQPAQVYWIGFNSPENKGFKSMTDQPIRPYALVFATRDSAHNPTPIPPYMVAMASQINAQSQPLVDEKQVLEAARRTELAWKFYWDSLSLMNRKQLQVAQERYEEAVVHFQGATALNPNNPSAWAGLGLCELRQHLLDAATHSTSRVFALHPDLRAGHIALALLAEGELKYIDRAIRHYKVAIEKTCQTEQDRILQLEAIGLLADCYLRNGRPSEAEPWIRRYLTINPTSETMQQKLTYATNSASSTAAPVAP